MSAWRRGERPPWPGNLSDADRKLVAADQALRNKPWPKGERYAQALERVAAEHGVVAEVLDHFHNSRGGPFERIVERAEEWEAAYRKAGLL